LNAEPFSKDAEKRIRRAVYCGKQLVEKRQTLWATRYDRALSAMKTQAELDETMRRLDILFPHLGLVEFVNR